MLILKEILENEEKTISKRNKIEIVCIGDSLTGWNNIANTPWPSEVYPTYLEKILKTEIANFGIAGSKSDRALELISDAQRYLTNIKTYIASFGTNDLGEDIPVEYKTKNILDNLTNAISEIKIKNKKIILLNVPNIKTSFYTKKDAEEMQLRRKYYNEKLSEFCKKQKIQAIDLYSLMQDNYLKDGLHTNRKGAMFIAEKIAEKLK
jgi:lysophospholipase L1-like esterase